MERRSFPDDPRPWRVLSREYLHRKPWLTVRQDRVLLPSGTEIGEYWVSEYPDWVNVVATTRRDDLVLIRQYRHVFGAYRDTVSPGLSQALPRAALWGLLVAKLIAGWGVQWDIEWHVRVGRDTFWIAPAHSQH